MKRYVLDLADTSRYISSSLAEFRERVQTLLAQGRFAEVVAYRTWEDTEPLPPQGTGPQLDPLMRAVAGEMQDTWNKDQRASRDRFLTDESSH
jgi:hypothetical protein